MAGRTVSNEAVLATQSLDNPRTANSPVAATNRTNRARLRGLLALLVALTGIAGTLFVRQAWRATERREAYLPDLEAAAKVAPFDGPLLIVLGGRQAQAGEFSAAAITLHRAIGAGENQADVWQIWAAADAAAGNRAEALAVLELGMRSLQSAKDAALLQAARERAGAVDAAAPPGALAQAISPQTIDEVLDKRIPGGFLNGLSSWRGRRNPEQSGYATRREWAAKSPNDAQAQRWWGLALVRNRRLAAAESVLQYAATLAPDDADVRMALANVLLQRGAAAKAGREYQTVLKLRRDYLPALLGLGQVALDKNLIALSVSVFQKATKIAPNSAEAWIGLGRAYYSTHIQLGQSVSAFEKAVPLAPNRTDFYPDYFRALRLTFRYAEAEALIRRRLQAAPDEGESHFLLALLLRDYQPTPERQVEAEQALRTSLKLTPRSAATETALAQLLLEQGKPDEAVALLNDVLTQDELNIKAIQMLERAYRQAGAANIADRFRQHATKQIRLAKRLGELQDAEHRNPGDLKVHNDLAKLYASLGRTAEAEQEKQFAAYLQTHPASARRGIETLDAATSVSHPVRNRNSH